MAFIAAQAIEKMVKEYRFSDPSFIAAQAIEKFMAPALAWAYSFIAAQAIEKESQRGPPFPW